MKHFLLALIGCLIGFCQAIAGEAPKKPAHAPASLELRDQHDAPQRLAFPGTNVVVLVIADKKGSEQIDGWVVAIKTRYAERIELRGLADLGSVPWFLRGKVRTGFQEAITYPVMLDWSGKVSPQFGYQADVANVLVIARDGSIDAHAAGSAGEPALKQVFAAIDAAMVKTASAHTNSSFRPTASLQP